MDNELQKKKPADKEKNNVRNMILLSSLAVMLLFIAELYLMIVMPIMIPAIVAVGVAIIGCAYLDLSAIMKWSRIKEKEQEEQYASVLKSEKASYLLIRKYFDEIEEQLTLMEDKISDPYQEIIAAQKATAKVTINRNKENTDALMNSNDKLLDIVLGFENKIDEMSNIFSGRMGEDVNSPNTDLIQMQMEISNQIRELELNLKGEILQAVSKLSSVSPQVVMAAPQVMPMQQPVVPPVSEEPEPLGDLELGGLGDLPDFTPLEAVEDEELVSSAIAEESDALVEAEEIFTFDEPEEPIAAPELESIMNEGIEVGVIPEAEPELEPIPEPEPIVKEVPPMPDLSDPNKVMSPDDIEALLASMAAEGETMSNDTQPIAEAIVEPELEPIPEPEPIVEEVKPMPDLSDPNRSMSPDEIAALFANLG